MIYDIEYNGMANGLENFSVGTGEVSLGFDIVSCELATVGESIDAWASPEVIAVIDAADDRGAAITWIVNACNDAYNALEEL